MFLLHLSGENVDQQKNEENLLFIIFAVHIDGHGKSQPCGMFYDGPVVHGYYKLRSFIFVVF
ncbi:hypothetical protein V6Z12_A05G013500 [Gossypium hirsutum]